MPKSKIKKDKPIWETNKNHITGYNIKSIDYELNEQFRKQERKKLKFNKNYKKK